VPLINAEQHDQPPPSIAEAQRQLEAAEHAERERVEEAKRAAAEQERQVDELRERAAGVVAEVERVVGDAVTFAANNPATTSRRARPIARAWLHGLLGDSAELTPSQNRAAGMVADQGAAQLLAAAEFAATRLDTLISMENEAFLTEADDAVQQLDRLEVEAWGGFVRRLQEIAGEV
jgi:hypothetical protein